MVKIPARSSDKQSGSKIKKTLQPGPMTLFAPTNAAFDALPPPTFTALVSDKIALQVFDGDGHDHGYNDDDGHYDDGGENDRSHIPQ